MPQTVLLFHLSQEDNKITIIYTTFCTGWLKSSKRISNYTVDLNSVGHHAIHQ